MHPRQIAGIKMWGMLPRSQDAVARHVADGIVAELARGGFAPGLEALATVEPLISAHLDSFLAVRLREKMPVISAFIGDKTVGKLKDAMMEEITVLLPQVIEQYSAGLAANKATKELVAARLAKYPVEEIAMHLQPFIQAAARKAPLAAIAGFLFGALLSAVLLLMSL